MKSLRKRLISLRRTRWGYVFIECSAFFLTVVAFRCLVCLAHARTLSLEGMFSHWGNFWFYPFGVASGWLVTTWAKKRRVKSKTVIRFDAKFLLCLLLPRENREGVIGDLTEEAEAIREEFGPTHARIFWCCEVFRSLVPLLCSSFQKLLGFGVLDWLRRHI